jgi:hypothetical protein
MIDFENPSPLDVADSVGAAIEAGPEDHDLAESAAEASMSASSISWVRAMPDDLGPGHLQSMNRATGGLPKEDAKPHHGTQRSPKKAMGEKIREEACLSGTARRLKRSKECHVLRGFACAVLVHERLCPQKKTNARSLRSDTPSVSRADRASFGMIGQGASLRPSRTRSCRCARFIVARFAVPDRRQSPRSAFGHERHAHRDEPARLRASSDEAHPGAWGWSHPWAATPSTSIIGEIGLDVVARAPLESHVGTERT